MVLPVAISAPHGAQLFFDLRGPHASNPNQLLAAGFSAAIVTDDRGTFKNFAKKAMQASFARPSTGGAASASFMALPIVPVMAFLRARGWTFT
jgi:hypothetical protein